MDTSYLVGFLERAEQRGRFYGVVIGIVTNLNDPDKLGRVKLKLPWLDDQAETTWARVAAPLAGSARGLATLPEVGDEVLVAFEHGDIAFPYVLGGLWNGKDAPPPVVDNGKVKVRSITTRAGHAIAFHEDEGGGKGKLTVTTADGRTLEISDKDEKITVRSKKHTITLDDRKGSVTIESGGELSLNGSGCALKFAQSGLELSHAGGALKIGASGIELVSKGNLDLKGNGIANLKTGGVLNIQGTLVKIN
ncbi:MAG: phage tail protein [Chloroflexales bacterium]|nr:phage tail protein [Chloroflexales bacterium]